MFGRRATLPIDIELRKAGPEEMLRKHLDAIPANEHDDFTRLQKERQKRLDEAKANIFAAQEKQKDQYDRKHACPECYQVDALVLKKDFLRKKRKGGKLDHRYVGPYKILKILTKGAYLLQLIANSEVVVRVTGSHLKPYNESVHDAGNEPPLKKSGMESPAGKAKTDSLPSTSADSLGCLSPAADQLKSPDTKTSSQSLPTIDSLESPKHLDAIPANEHDDFTRLQKERQKRLDEAKANILAAQEKQKDQYDRKHACPECYQVDALVLKKDFLRKKRKGGKLDHRYVGPYKILKILTKGAYLLQLVANSEVVVRVTGSHLKPYNESVHDAGNEPPLKKSGMESPAGKAKTDSLPSTSADSLGCLSPAADQLKSPDTKTSSQSLPTIDSLESPKACSTPNHLSSSLNTSICTQETPIFL